MSEEGKLAGARGAGQIERLARLLAIKGDAEVTMVLAIARRAEALLADPAFAATITAAEEAAVPAPFAWEAEEVLPVGSRVSVWPARFDDFSRGDGLPLHFAAALARSEAEFRDASRWNWGRVSPTAPGSGAASTPRWRFLSPTLRRTFEAFEARERPATFSFIARCHANYS